MYVITSKINHATSGKMAVRYCVVKTLIYREISQSSRARHLTLANEDLDQ